MRPTTPIQHCPSTSAQVVNANGDFFFFFSGQNYHRQIKILQYKVLATTQSIHFLSFFIFSYGGHIYPAGFAAPWSAFHEFVKLGNIHFNKSDLDINHSELTKQMFCFQLRPIIILHNSVMLFYLQLGICCICVSHCFTVSFAVYIMLFTAMNWWAVQGGHTKNWYWLKSKSIGQAF